MFSFYLFLQLNQLLPIIDANCSPHARFLICSSLFPLCSPDVSLPVAACRSLCEIVKIDCFTDSTLELLWPKFIDCSTMLQPEKQELCMQIPQDEMKVRTTAAVTIKPTTAPVFPKSFWPWLSSAPVSIGKSTAIHPPISIGSFFCPTNFTAVIPDTKNMCKPKCGTDAMYTQKQKNIAELWILALSAICFILTLFSLVTFWAEPMRFGYPERPVLYLALCYNLLSVCYLERVIFHTPAKERTVTTTYEIQQQSDDDSINLMCNNAISLSPCFASYIITSYLTLSASMWWLIFSICWYLSTEKQWSSEALEKKAGFFHIIAWIPTLAPPIIALFCGAVTQQELTGMCASIGYIEIPTLVLLVSGAIFTILASKSLKGLSKTVAENMFNKRLSQVRIRILMFSCVFFVPAFFAVLLSFFEEIDGLVPYCNGNILCVHNKMYSSIPTLLRLFLVLAGGSLAGMWVWSKKTCDSYRNRIITSPASNPSSTVIKYGNGGITYGNGNSNYVLVAKKNVPKHIGPLYAGINFHNVPVSTNNIAEGVF